MVYKRYIKKNGKVYGPYIQHNRKVNGKVVTEYHGKHKSNSWVGSVKLFLLISLGIVGIFLLSFLFLQFQSTGFSVSNIQTPIILEPVQNFYSFIIGYVVDESADEPVEEPEDVVEEEPVPESEPAQESDQLVEEEPVEESTEEELVEEPVEEDVESNETIEEEVEINETIEPEIIVNETVSNETVLNETIGQEPIIGTNETIIKTNVTDTNLTETNITIANETVRNVTIGNISVETTQYGAVINEPVKWKKKIKLDKEANNISVTLPKEAENISVYKIVNDEKEEIEEGDVSESEEVIDVEEEITDEGIGHCYDNETEILTDEGWKLFSDLNKEEEVATLNQDTGELEWQMPLEWQEFDNYGEMYRIETEEGDLLVSEKHRVYSSSKNLFNSVVLNTGTCVCSLKCRSFDQTGILRSKANARKGTSVSCDINCEALTLDSSEGDANSINSDNREMLSKKVSLETFDLEQILSEYLCSSLINDLGANNLRPYSLNNLFVNESFLNRENIMLVSTTNFIFNQDLEDLSISSFNFLPNSIQSSSVNSEFSKSFLNFSNTSSCNILLANASLAIEDQLSHSNLSIFSLNSFGTDKVKDGIFTSYTYYTCYMFNNTYKVFKPFDPQDFSLQPITQIYNDINQGKEVYFLDENNEPVKIKSISKEDYEGKIYDVDVENDVVLVRRNNSKGVWSGNSNNGTNQTVTKETIEAVEETREEVSNQSITITAQVISGKVISVKVLSEEEKKSFLDLLKKIILGITGFVVDIEETEKNVTEVIIEDNATEYEIEYETPAPIAIENETNFGKQINVSSEVHYENVLSYAYLLQEVEPANVRLYDENEQEVEVDRYDTNENGLVDYIEWTIPNMSEHVYDMKVDNRTGKVKSYDINTERLYDNDVRQGNMLLYGGVKNVKEDGHWKDVNEARILKDKEGFSSSLIEDDENFPLDVVDYNKTSITFNISITNSEDVGQNIPLRMKEKSSLNITQILEISFNDTDEWKTVTIIADPFQSLFEWGYNSSEVIINGITDVEDAYIDELLPDRNFGASTTLITGNPASLSQTRRSLIRFKNISGNVGADKVVDSATMYIYCSDEATGTDDNVSAYRVLKNWIEGESDDVNPANDSSVTWVDWQNDDLEWAADGANNTCASASCTENSGDGSGDDRSDTAEDSDEIQARNVWNEWNLTTAVRNWYNGSWSEYGVILISDSEISYSRKTFNSSEAGAGFQPYLNITYSIVTASDNEYPIFSNYWDNNATLEVSGTGLFNVTLLSTNGTVWLEINNTNYTATNVTASVYNASVPFTANGTYIYRWHSWGNGTEENYNVSGDRSYSVTRVFPLINFTNPTPPNATTTSNTSIEINVSITEENLDTVIWNWNGTNFTMFNDSLILMMNFDNVSALGESYNNSNGSIILDISGFENNGTLYTGAAGDITYSSTSGKYGGAFEFDGVDDGIQVSNSDSLENITESNYSWGGWYYPNIAEGSHAIVCKEGFHTLLKYIADQKFYFTIYNVSNRAYNVESSSTYSPGNWYFVFGTLNTESKTILLYVNGALAGNQSYTGALKDYGTNPIRIGYCGVGTAFDWEANGSIDEVRIWNRTLSAAEIYQHYVSNLKKFNQTQWTLYVNQSQNTTDGLTDGNYTYQAFAEDEAGNLNFTDERSVTIDTSETTFPELNFTAPTPPNATTTSNTSIEINVSIVEENLDTVIWNWNGTNFTMFNDSLILMMNFDNVSALGENDTYVFDVSGNGNNGIAVGSPIINSSGRYGGGVSFDNLGTDYFAVHSLATDINKSQGTYELWLKMDSSILTSKLGYGILEVGYSGDNDDYIGIRKGVCGVFDCLDFIYRCDDILAEAKILDLTGYDEWKHIAATWNSTNLTIYSNGHLNYSGSSACVISGELDQAVIGTEAQQNIGDVLFKGSIDEVRVWNRVLTADEIYEHYISNLHKFNQSQWYLYVNQSKNATDGLIDGTYTYQAFAEDDSGNLNMTEVRSVEVDILNDAPIINTSRIYSSTNTTAVPLLGFCNATDADDDAEIQKFEYQWYNNSVVYVNGTAFKEGSISAGTHHTCGIRASDSRILCWGSGGYGQLGDGDTSAHNVSTPNLTQDSSSYLSISAGYFYTCGIRANDSRILCWGYGGYGQLGDGDTSSHNVATPNLTLDSSGYSSFFGNGVESFVSLIDKQFLTADDNWTLSCRAYDNNNTDFSSWLNSSGLVISRVVPNNAPITNTSRLDSSTNTTTVPLGGFCNATDADSENLSYFYEWYKDDSLYSFGSLSNYTGEAVQVGWISNSSSLGAAKDVFISGDYAYVAVAQGTNNSLTIINVSDPTNPIQVGYLSNTSSLNGAQGVYISGDYAYVAVYTNDALTIINISDPIDPRQVGYITNSSSLGGANSIYVQGDYAYISSHNDALTIINISDPTNPNQVYSITNSSSINLPLSVLVSGDYVYVVAYQSDSLTIINISDPTNPNQVGWLQNSTSLNIVYDLHVQRDYAYLVSQDDILTIINISDSTNPNQVYSITNSSSLNQAESIYVSGDYAYVTSLGDTALTILDIADGFPQGMEINVQNLTANQLDDFPGANWSLGCRAYDNTDFSSWLNSSGLVIVGNNPPDDPSLVALVSVDATNKSNADLNCSANITDQDSGDTLDVSVRWYRNEVLNFTIDYDNSYSNGTEFSAILDSGNLTKGENWSCSIRLYDGTDYSNWVNSTNITILNSLPTVTLTSPDDNTVTTDRTPEFNWSSSDSDDDSLTYQINITLIGAGTCSDTDRDDSGFATANYTPSSILNCLSDNNDYYNWSVRANDGDGWGAWTTARKINVSALVTAVLVNDTMNFGTMNLGDSDNTTDGTPSPFVLRNDGNCLTNVTINASSLWTSVALNTSYYQFKVDNNSGEEGAFNWLLSQITWSNLTETNQIVFVELNWSDATDSAEVEILVEVPSSELAAIKSSTIYFGSSLAE
ncbi:MAG: LamG-like jellyroll fold domain-containing protein [archaeon]